MRAITIASIIFACTVGGIIVGHVLQRVLPAAHLDETSRDIVTLGTGLVATMAALVLGLLIGAAKSSFDAQRDGFQRLATDLILLDRTLAHYGHDAQAARDKLHAMVDEMLAQIWPGEAALPRALDAKELTSRGGELLKAIEQLPAHDLGHRGAQENALKLSMEIARQRWELTQPDADSLPVAFLVVLAFWLFVLFACFGLFSPRNATMTTVLLVCGLSVAGAVLLIVDLDQPFDGMIQISDVPLRQAREHLGK